MLGSLFQWSCALWFHTLSDKKAPTLSTQQAPWSQSPWKYRSRNKDPASHQHVTPRHCQLTPHSVPQLRRAWWEGHAHTSQPVVKCATKRQMQPPEWEARTKSSSSLQNIQRNHGGMGSVGLENTWGTLEWWAAAAEQLGFSRRKPLPFYSYLFKRSVFQML